LTSRAIVRAQDTRAGMWVIEGTLIRVADLKRDFQVAGNQVFPVYRAMGLTDAEINAGLAFDFPPIRGTTLNVRLIDLVIDCECGEHTQAVRSGAGNDPVECICGRIWQIPLPDRPNAYVDMLESNAQQGGQLLPRQRQSPPAGGAPLETGPISLDVTVIIRAQQLVDRWSRSGQRERFADVIERAAAEFDRDLAEPNSYRAQFIAVGEEIRAGRGHAFTNRGPLLAMLQTLRDHG
jgi:hypothetical protein